MTRKEKFEDYEGFVEKFKPKKTTDDCFTPEPIYQVIKDYACQRFGIDPEKVVRPFWPGGDYENFDYSGGKVVIDNPPFSILSKICDLYLDKKIPFFLFAPGNTCLSSANAMRVNHIICDSPIIYDNGAKIPTCFITSFGLPTILEACPELTDLINAKTKSLQKGTVKHVPIYEYPPNIVTAAMCRKYAQYGIHYNVSRHEVRRISALDVQKTLKKSIFGGGLLVSDKKAAERAAAEKAAERVSAEKAAERAAERHRNAIVWELSGREKAIVADLSRAEEEEEEAKNNEE